MKQDVIDFLGNPPKNESERFNKAVSLYRQSKDHDVTLVRFLNSMGFSKDRLDNVLYELKKLHSVTDLEIANARPKKEKIIKLNPEHEEIKAELKEFDIEAAEYGALKSMAAKVSKLTKKDPVDQKGDTLKPFVADAQNEFFPPETVTMTLEEMIALEDEILEMNIDEATKESLSEIFEKTKVILEQQGVDVPEGISKVEFFEALKKDIIEYRAKAAQDEANKLEVKDPVTETGDSSDDKKDVSTPLDVTKKDGEGKKDDSTKSDDTKGEGEKEDASTVTDEFKKKLADFDVEAEKYNSIKSFAADVSDVIKKDPKDQKGDTLKNFILEAKKKFAES